MNTKRERTGQYSLTLALDYILRKEIASKSRLRNLYGLDPKTLLKVEDGMKLSVSAHRRYLEVFVGIINKYRVMHPECEDELNKVLADILLVECGIKTDEERKASFAEERRREYFKSISSGKI